MNVCIPIALVVWPDVTGPAAVEATHFHASGTNHSIDSLSDRFLIRSSFALQLLVSSPHDKTGKLIVGIVGTV